MKPRGRLEPRMSSSLLSFLVCLWGMIAVANGCCPAGKYGRDDGTRDGFYNCIACPANYWVDECTYVNYLAPSPCYYVPAPCGPGYWGPSGSCSLCPVNTYKGWTGAEACTYCINSVTLTEGNTAISACKCNSGYAGSDGSMCAACAAGKYKGASVATTCLDCVAGKYGAVSGLAVCTNCPAGTYQGFLGATAASTCQSCVAGKYGAVSGLAVCTNCPAGTYQGFLGATAASTCQSCVAGKYSANGASACTDCIAGKYLGFQGATTHNICQNCVAGKYSLSGASACTLCVADTYSKTGATGCIPCPTGAVAAAGSTTASACTCKLPKFLNILDLNLNTFECVCPGGYYLDPQKEICRECQYCPKGYWNKGCGNQTDGQCTKCTACNRGLLRVGCHYIYQGECVEENLLSREPLCPLQKEEETFTNLRQNVAGMQDLGGFGFEDVFGVTWKRANFRCTDVCDGSTNDDGTMCGGPFACGVRTCVENMRADISVTRARYDVLTCPVVINQKDSVDDKIKKMNSSCVSCEDCGKHRISINNWGQGCARECSQLRCSDSEIWDWTVKKCVKCEELRDERLCYQTENEVFKNMRVTGNLRQVKFPYCRPSGQLHQIEYGECKSCEELRDCSDKQYPDPCAQNTDEDNYGCPFCVRSFHGDVKVVQGKYKKKLGDDASILYCQITECEKEGNMQKTGVRQHAICTDICEDLKCGEHEILVPCRLPHQTRCDALWPAGGEVAQAFTNQHRSHIASADVNLLSETVGPVTGFASFENTLITLSKLQPSHHYQCVWNAAGIIDNRALPGGISEYMFPPANVYAGLDGRGSKACEIWEVDQEEEFPELLPLQNTVSGISDRRVLINTEAHVLSYEFDGDFSEVDRDAGSRQKIGPVDVGLERLGGAHLGGSGKLYLMLTLRAQAARVVIDVPADRNLQAWPKSLLLTFAVACMSQGQVQVSVQGKHQNMEKISQSQIDSQALGILRLDATEKARNLLQCKQDIEIRENGLKFLQNKGTSMALRYSKPVPMRIEIVNKKKLVIPLELFFRKESFESKWVAAAELHPGEVQVGSPSVDVFEQDQRTALRLLQNFTALDHINHANGVYERALTGWLSNETMKQAHAVDAYSKCAVLISTNTSVFCAGSEGLEKYWSRSDNYPTKELLGVGFFNAEYGRHSVLVLLKDRDKTQHLFELDGQKAQMINNFPDPILWRSFTVSGASVLALQYSEDDRKLKVCKYKYQSSNMTNLPFVLDRTWGTQNVFGSRNFNDDLWLSFSRVVVTPQSLHALVVTVVEAELLVCTVPLVASPQAGSRVLCDEIALTPGTAPSFISAGLLARQRWVVGVHGKVFEFEAGVLHDVGSSKLAESSFVQVGAASQVQQNLSQSKDGLARTDYGMLYYTMHASVLKNGGLLAFLPGFSRNAMSEDITKEEAYEVLVAYTGGEKTTLGDVTISIKPANYVVAWSGQPASLVRKFDWSEEELPAAYAWYPRVDADILLGLGMPLVMYCKKEEKLDEGERGEDVLLLLSAACNTSESWAFLVRVGYAMGNSESNRGLAVGRCKTECDPSVMGYEFIEGYNSGDRHNSTSAVVTYKDGEWSMFKMNDENTVETIHPQDGSRKGATCIALAPGSAIVAAQHYTSKRTVHALLQAPSAPGLQRTNVLQKWVRERRVLGASPSMRVELRFEHTSTAEQRPSIGLDDVQLLPMLSESTDLVDGYLEADVRMPSRAELEQVGLDYLVGGSTTQEGAQSEYSAWEWERLHVTVALQLEEEKSNCMYKVQFYYHDKENRDFFLPLGCEFTTSSAHVRGAWAQCMLELPLHRPNMQLVVRVSVLYEQPLCRVSAQDKLLVFIDANRALYECPPGSFLAGGATQHRGACILCRGEIDVEHAPTLAEEAAFCKKGWRLQGCPALLVGSHPTQSCTQCENLPHGAVFADVGRDDAKPCAWKCEAGLHEAGHGSGRKCVSCTKPFSCTAGHYWRNCSETADSTCTACPDLRNRADVDGMVHEQYMNAADEEQQQDVTVYPLAADAPAAERERLEAQLKLASGTHACRSRCVSGAFRSSKDGLCKRCTRHQDVLERTQLENKALGVFWAVVPCSSANDSFAMPCVERDGSRIVGHDPDATGDCPRECLSGWRASFNETLGYVDSCTQCGNVTFVEAQNGEPDVRTTLAPAAGPLVAFSPNSCALACKPPYVLLRERLRWVHESGFEREGLVNESAVPGVELDPERTCVRCSEDACGLGSYPTGLLCACEACVMHD